MTDKSRRRPGDVSIKDWSLRRGLAIDVAVICPLAASHLRSSEPCESYAKSEKIDRYAPAFVNSDYDFVPVVFETSGAVNKEGETVLKQIMESHTLFMLLVPGPGFCCVQAAGAQQILNRDYVDPTDVANILSNLEPLLARTFLAPKMGGGKRTDNGNIDREATPKAILD